MLLTSSLLIPLRAKREGEFIEIRHIIFFALLTTQTHTLRFATQISPLLNQQLCLVWGTGTPHIVTGKDTRIKGAAFTNNFCSEESYT